MGLVVIYTRETDGGEEKHKKKKKGYSPNPLPSFPTVVSQTFFIIIMFIVYIILIKKHAGVYFSFPTKQKKPKN